MKKRILSVLLALILTLSLVGCGGSKTTAAPEATAAPAEAPAEAPAAEEPAAKAPAAEEPAAEEPAAEPEAAPVEKNGDIVILYTSDVHCGIDQGFGYAGLCQVREAFEA